MQQSPVAIGGVGGSGTRVIAGALQKFGYYLGDDLNEALDNLWFTLLFKRLSLWPVSAHREEIEQLLKLFVKRMSGQLDVSHSDQRLLESCVDEETEELPLPWRQARLISLLEERRNPEPDCWGWKEPNTHIVLPILLTSLPGLKYVHVMRHGLDMAFSSNQHQLKLWGGSLLQREISIDEPADSLSYWCAVHQRLLTLSAGFPGQFLLLNFDDFCRHPDRELGNLAAFLEISPDRDVFAQAIEGVSVPESTGRHHDRDLSSFDDQDLQFVRQMGFEL